MIGSAPRHWGGGGRWGGGGVATHLQELIPALHSLGVSVRLLAENVAAGQGCAPADITLSGMTRTPTTLLQQAGRPALVWGWRLAWQAGGIPWGQRLRFWGSAMNYSHFLAVDPPQLLHLHNARHRTFLTRHILRQTVPVVVTLHSVNELVDANADHAWLAHLSRLAYRQPLHFIAVSHYVRNAAIAHGADPARVTVIPNGVDGQRFQPGDPTEARASLHLPSAPTLLFTGNLTPRKGVDVLLRALAACAPACPTTQLVIVGEGEERVSLQALAQTLGLADRVHFVGFQPHPTLSRWYQAADIFVLPSWAEGLSISLLEGMAAGRPVVASQPESGAHDAVEPGVTGLLTPYGDVPALAQALTALLERPAWAQQLGAQARQRAETAFNWGPIARRTLAVYAQALAAGGR